MGFKIIDNKKIEMSEDEWEMFQKICRSYDGPAIKGEELFKEMFETDDNGIIIFIKPSTKRYTSMEAFMFMNSIMMHQHLRAMWKRVDETIEDLNKKFENLEKSLNKNS